MLLFLRKLSPVDVLSKLCSDVEGFGCWVLFRHGGTKREVLQEIREDGGYDIRTER